MEQTKTHPSVLLVENDPADAELTLAAFAENGVNDCVVTNDGLEALDWLQCRGRYADRQPCARPRLVVTDLHMPRMDGLDLLRRIRADQRFRDLPVVVLSASREQQDEAASYRLGADAFARKPDSFGEFQQTVARLREEWLLRERRHE